METKQNFSNQHYAPFTAFLTSTFIDLKLDDPWYIISMPTDPLLHPISALTPANGTVTGITQNNRTEQNLQETYSNF